MNDIQKHRVLTMMLEDLAKDLADGGLHVAYDRDFDFQIVKDLWDDVKKAGREVLREAAEREA